MVSTSRPASASQAPRSCEVRSSGSPDEKPSRNSTAMRRERKTSRSTPADATPCPGNLARPGRSLTAAGGLEAPLHQRDRRLERGLAHHAPRPQLHLGQHDRQDVLEDGDVEAHERAGGALPIEEVRVELERGRRRASGRERDTSAPMVEIEVDVREAEASERRAMVLVDLEHVEPEDELLAELVHLARDDVGAGHFLRAGGPDTGDDRQQGTYAARPHEIEDSSPQRQCQCLLRPTWRTSPAMINLLP